MKHVCIFFVAFSLWFSAANAQALKVRKIETIDSGVLSSFPVGFSLRIEGENMYVSYYDAEKNMVVATRKLHGDKWTRQILPTKIGWDSHNYIAMAIDNEGYIHVSGNNHANPLNYFRSEKPYDVTTLVRMSKMVDTIQEQHATYPEFMKNKDGNLIFHYRVGRSGDGFEIYNIYDTGSGTWKRMFDTPLIDGFGKRNAYMYGPLLGKDGYYHLIWVWRETPDCATNNTLSYARSNDLVHWESIRGEKVTLPMNIDQKELVVDPVPVHGGLINPGIRLGFDSKGQPIIGYHKYDEKKNMQLYITRFENGKWRIQQLTDWNYRWDFGGGGTMQLELKLGALKPAGKGKISFDFNQIQWGDKRIFLNEKTLKTIRITNNPDLFPEDIRNARSKFVSTDGRTMVANISTCNNYLIRWESLQSNRDRAPEKGATLPPPSALELYEVEAGR